MIDYNEYAKNVNAFPKERLLQYAGKYVAWSEDGTDIIAAAEDIPQLIDAVDAKYPVGYDFMIHYVPAPGEDCRRPPFFGIATDDGIIGAES